LLPYETYFARKWLDKINKQYTVTVLNTHLNNDSKLWIATIPNKQGMLPCYHRQLYEPGEFGIMGPCGGGGQVEVGSDYEDDD